jgi:hypothetical protein
MYMRNLRNLWFPIFLLTPPLPGHNIIQNRDYFENNEDLLCH